MSDEEGERSIRAHVLAEAHRLTTGDRNQAYGDPTVSTACAAELKEIFWRYADFSKLREDFPYAERECLDMVMTKLSRIACGTLKLDNYIDAAAYIAMAYEGAARAASEEDQPE